MRNERWEEVQRLYWRAIELPLEEREAFVQREAGGDAELAHEILRMLQAGPRTTFLAPPTPLGPPTGEIPRRLGDFELLQEIGRGGMGIVYRARQLSLGREVALKILPPSLSLPQRQIERFQREAKAAGRLHHPNIVSILTVGQDGELRFIAMELVSGLNLAEELKRLREEKNVRDDTTAHLPSSHASSFFRRVGEIVRQAADALQHAHEHKIVHRDIKPSNLLLDTEGNVRIVDFGLARDEEQGTITKTGELAGTPHYMSPEQARASRQRVDHRTDVYSLGVVLYELLTLRRPFEGRTSQEVIHNILEREPQRIRKLNPRVPRDLEVICTTAMAKALSERYATAAELRDDLARFLAHQAIRARPPSLWQIARAIAKKHRVALAAGFLLVLGSGTGIAWQEAAQARRLRAADEARLRELEKAVDWSALETDRLAEARRALQRLTRRVDIDPDRARSFEARYEALRRNWRDRAIAEIESGRRESSPQAVDGLDDARAIEGLLLLNRALVVFPEDAELAALVTPDLFHPRLSVSAVDEAGNPLTGQVSCLPLDPQTGAPGQELVLGPLPLQERRLPPGYYRILVRAAGHAPRELTRLLRRGRDPEPVRCLVGEDAQRLANMRRIQGDTLRLPAHPERNCPLLGHEVEVAPFYLDEAPVTNAEYRAFLAATARPTPQNWEYLPSDPRYDELPAAAIDWNDALAYAEWRGKRLPSHAEWALAVRGTTGEPFELARGSGELFSAAEALGPRIEGTPAEMFSVYLAGVPPARASTAVRGRNGLLLVPGGMYEWTESLGYELSSEGYAPRNGMRLLLSPTRYTNYAQSPHALAAPPDTNARCGFRCALSEEP